MRASVIALLLPLVLACPGCMRAQTSGGMDCAVVSGAPMLVVELYFGRNIGDRLGVTDEAWTRFVDQEVTPRFPNGLTVLNATGQWRDTETGRTVQEPSKVLSIIAAQDPATLARLSEIAEAYKTRFQQQAVGTVVRPACVHF